MGSNEVKKIYETIVKYNKQKFDTRLIITVKKIELEKKKGLFKKTYKVIETINIDDIRVKNDKAQVSNKNTEVVIETINKTLKVSCNNIVEAKKQPKVVIFKNVAAITHSKMKKTLTLFKNDLESLGYSLYDNVLCALDYGTPQNRDRYFLVLLRGNFYISFLKKKIEIMFKRFIRKGD